MTDRSSCPRTGLAVVFLVFVLVGCASTPPTRFYVLSPEKGQGMGGGPCVSIGIGPVKIPDYLDRSGIVTCITAHEIRVAEFNKWAEPLEENFPRVLAENLTSLLCTKTVAILPWQRPVPVDYRIYVDVIRMDGILGESASLDVSWTLLDGTGRKGVLTMKRVSYKEPTGGQDYEDFVSAQSRNIGSLGREIANTIRGLSP